MEYTQLNDGKTKVSKLSLGTWSFSGAAVWGECDDSKAINTVHEALDAGINLIDTAEAYGDGQAELVVGKALKGRRQEAILATKVYSNHLDYQGVIDSCEGSLKRLDTDYLDMLQIHWPNADIPVEETFRAFDKLKQDGKLRMVSVCNHGIHATEAISNQQVVLNQLPYSLVWRLAEYQLSPVMKSNQIKIWAYSPLGQGLLTGKFKTLEDVPVNRRANRMYDSKWNPGRHTDHGFEKEIFSFLQELDQVCQESGYSMAELAFGFLKEVNNMGSILVGARNTSQLAQNIEAYKKKIPSDIVKKIDQMSLELKSQMGTNPDLWENAVNKYGTEGRYY